MIRIVKSILGTDNDNNYYHLINIRDQVSEGLSPQESSCIKYLIESYNIHSKFPTGEIFLSKFPEYTASFNENKSLNDESLSYYVYEFIHNKKKQIAARKMMEFSASVVSGPDGLTQDMIESLREFVITNDDPIDETKNNVIDLYEDSKKRGVNGDIKTFVPEIDDLIGGIEVGTVTVISGFTGCGKSSWAVNIAYKCARSGKSIVYISLEMTQRDLLYNLVSLHSLDPKFKGNSIPSAMIRRKKMNEEQEKYFKYVAEDFNKTIAPNLRILTEVSFHNFSQGEVRDILYRLDDEKSIDALFIDQANLLKFYSKSKFSNVGDSINEYVSFFRRLAINFRKSEDKLKQIAVFMLCQCNRQGWLKARKQKDQNLIGMYDMTALAEANELERCATTILMIYSDDDLKLVEEARVQLLKSRFGRGHEEPISIAFRPEYCQVGELSDMSNNNTFSYNENVFDELLNSTPSDLGFTSLSDIDLSNLDV